MKTKPTPIEQSMKEAGEIKNKLVAYFYEPPEILEELNKKDEIIRRLKHES